MKAEEARSALKGGRGSLQKVRNPKEKRELPAITTSKREAHSACSNAKSAEEFT